MIIYSDTNSILPDHAQPVRPGLTVKKTLRVAAPGRQEGGTLYFTGEKSSSGPAELNVVFNNRRIGRLRGHSKGMAMTWNKVDVPAELIKRGRNDVVFSIAPGSTGSWAIGISSTEAPGDSFVSTDRGKSWRNRNLGAYSALNGEFIVRLRLAEGKAPRKPPLLTESPDNPQRVQLRRSLPDSLKAKGIEPFTRARRLCSWLSGRLIWVTGRHGASRYTPWNYWDILRDSAENEKLMRQGKPPRNITMCVQFSAAYVQAATALGLKARSIITTSGIKETGGHCFSEIWIDSLKKWAICDPTGDFCFLDENKTPMSAVELYDNRKKLPQWIAFGRSAPRHASRLGDCIDTWVKTGLTYRNVGYWRRTDFFSHPEATPSAHGSVTYCEPDLVWIDGSDPLIEAFPFDCR
jgi:hypothetical protein